MVKEAEKYAADDKKQKDRIEARHELEHFLYSTQQKLTETGELSKTLSELDRSELQESLKTELTWLENNQEADTESFREKLDEVKKIVESKLNRSRNKGESNNQQTQTNDEL